MELVTGEDFIIPDCRALFECLRDANTRCQYLKRGYSSHAGTSNERKEDRYFAYLPYNYHAGISSVRDVLLLLGFKISADITPAEESWQRRVGAVAAWAGMHAETNVPTAHSSAALAEPSRTVTHWIHVESFHTRVGQVPLFLAWMAPFMEEGSRIVFQENGWGRSSEDFDSDARCVVYQVLSGKLWESHTDARGNRSELQPYVECLYMRPPWVNTPQVMYIDPYGDVAAQVAAANGGVEIRESFDSYGHISHRFSFVDGVQHGPSHYFGYMGGGEHGHSVVSYVDGLSHGWNVDDDGSRDLYLKGKWICDKDVIAAYEAAASTLTATDALTVADGAAAGTAVTSAAAVACVEALFIHPTPDKPQWQRNRGYILVSFS